MDNSEIYKGYIPLRENKTAAEKYGEERTDPLHTWEEAQGFTGIGAVMNDNVVLVDVDDRDEADTLERILEKHSIAARITITDRGSHFLFSCDRPLRNLSGLVSLIGIKCDYKYGATTSYDVIKANKKWRTIKKDPPHLSKIPIWLNPKEQKQNKEPHSEIWHLDVGSRNETLYKWTGKTLTDKNKKKYNPVSEMTFAEWKTMKRIINDDILAEPLDSDEFESLVTRDRYEESKSFAADAKEKSSGEKLSDIIEEMITTCSIRQFGNALFRKGDNKYYKMLAQGFIDNELLVKRGVNPEKATAATRLIRAHLKDEWVPYTTNVVGFRNGAFDWSACKFINYTDLGDVPVFQYCDVDYDPNVDTTEVESVLRDWCDGNEDKYKMLTELAGCCFYKGIPIKKWWVIAGKADTGKSTFLRLLRNVLGPDMVGSTPIQSLGDTNAIAELVNKPVNIVDDGSSRKAGDVSNLRKIIQGDEIQVKVLYQDKFTTRLESRMVFVFNEIPRYRDDANATAKKMMIIRFNRVYDDNEKDPDLIDKLTSEENRSAFLKLAIDAMKDVIKRKYIFTESDESKIEVQEIVRDADQVLSYVDSIVGEDFSWEQFLDDRSTKDVYQEFYNWARSEGYDRPVVQQTFSSKIKEISGARVRKSHGSSFYAFDEYTRKT